VACECHRNMRREIEEIFSLDMASISRLGLGG
jgi:hypothetical protein